MGRDMSFRLISERLLYAFGHNVATSCGCDGFYLFTGAFIVAREEGQGRRLLNSGSSTIME
jgi:hypothetical protein